MTDVARETSEINSENVSPHRIKKAKRVRFLCNGDKFCKGIMIPINSVRYRSFDSLLTDLTRIFSENVNLPCGVRTIFSMDGQRICDLSQLHDGKLYVCSSSGDGFKKVDYLSSNSLPRIKRERSFSKLQNNNNNQNINSLYKYTNNCSIRPRIVILVRNGNRPRKIIRLLLNKRNAPSFEHALSTITEAVKLDTGAVRKVYTMNGVQLSHLEEFFGDEDVFIVYGSERLYNDDFELDSEEVKAIQIQKKSLRRPENENRKGLVLERTPKMPNKTKDIEVNKSDFNLNIPSKILSRHMLTKIIGEGNFAIVHHCVDRTTGQEYALKIIDKSKCCGKEHMITNEVQILKTVQHPNIVQYVADYETPNEHFIMMELIVGGDLFDAVAKHVKFSEENAQVMMMNLASALAYLHENHIVHRDIKPENLMVQMDDKNVICLKVADFGLAQKVNGPVFTVCGTPTYVAPEILSEVGYGVKIDVWAAGVILYIVLCGFPPFVSEHDNQEELFDDILSGVYSFPSPYWDEVSDQAKDLISHMLQSNCELRFSAEDVLDHPWLERS